MRKIFFLLVLFILFSCSHKQPKIYLSKDYKGSVKKWLLNNDSSLKIRSLYGKNLDSLDFILKDADGIVITGGDDVWYGWYGNDSLAKYCGKPDLYRDSLELHMIKYALKHKIPLLGICRGQQIINVATGGSLIADIPHFVGDSLHRRNGAVYHYVYFTDTNFVHLDSADVYSNHHQAIDRLSTMFKPVAYAKDSIIEAILIKDTLKYPYAFAIQFHPEAMDYKSPISSRIAGLFVSKVRVHYGKN